MARRSFLIPSQLRPPLLLRSQRPRAPQAGRPGSPRPMVPHMAWGRRSRIHLRSMSLARLRQPPLPSDGHYPCLSAWPRSSPGQRDHLRARPTLLAHHLLDELPALPQTTCVCTRRTRQGAHEPQGAASLDHSFDGGCQSLCLPRCWMLVPSQAHRFGKHVMIYIC